MAGGIFTDRPFELNPKCLAIATAASIVYWLAPRSALMLPVLFIVVYILIAWYDYAYNCSVPLASGRLGVQASIDSIFKPDVPPDIRATGDDKPYLDSAESAALKKRNTYIFHLVVAAPALMYVGLRGKDAAPSSFSLLVVLGAGAAAYHGYRLYEYNNDIVAAM